MFNVYFYYKDIQKITSPWIRSHCLPQHYIYHTTYTNIVPAYLSLMRYALTNDRKNQWFCFLTETCCPIISPGKFREIFQQNHQNSLLRWKQPWWNIHLVRRANLAGLPNHLQLGHDPWFVLTREHVYKCIDFVLKNATMTKYISDGGIANESLFAIALQPELNNQNKCIINASSHLVNWEYRSSSTSPYVFTYKDPIGISILFDAFQKKEKRQNQTIKNQTNKYVLFVRKVDKSFSNDILNKYIYEINTTYIEFIYNLFTYMVCRIISFFLLDFFY